MRFQRSRMLLCSLYAFHENTSLRLFLRRIRAREDQDDEMCFSILIRRFEGDDGRRNVSSSRGIHRGRYLRRIYKKNIEIHQPCTEST